MMDVIREPSYMERALRQRFDALTSQPMTPDRMQLVDGVLDQYNKLADVKALRSLGRAGLGGEVYIGPLQEQGSDND